MLSLLLPGTSVTYYVEEIGLLDNKISYEQTIDTKGCNFGPEKYSLISRDPERTPVQWDTSPFAGFTKGNTTWLPVNENYKLLNVQTEQSLPQSSYKLYSNLAVLRKRKTFRQGKLDFLSSTSTDILAFIRSMKNHPSYIILINTSLKTKLVNLLKDEAQNLPEEATVILKSSHDVRKQTDTGKVLSLSSISLEAGEGMVLVYV